MNKLSENNQDSGFQDFKEAQQSDVGFSDFAAPEPPQENHASQPFENQSESSGESFQPLPHFAQQPDIQQGGAAGEAGFVPQTQISSQGHFIVDKRDIPKRSFLQRVNRGMILLLVCVLIAVGISVTEGVKNKTRESKLDDLYSKIEPAVMESLFPSEEYAKELSKIRVEGEQSEENIKKYTSDYYGGEQSADYSAEISRNKYLSEKRDEYGSKYKDLFVSESSKNTVLNRIVAGGYDIDVVSTGYYAKDYSDGHLINRRFAHNDGLAQLNLVKRYTFSKSFGGNGKSSAEEQEIIIKILAYEVDGEWKIKDFNIEKYYNYSDSDFSYGGGYYW